MSSSRLLESFNKKDKYGEPINPGCVCVWGSSRGAILCVYVGVTNGNSASGRYGRFITEGGIKSIAHKSVVVASNPMGMNITHTLSKKLLQRYYEGLGWEKRVYL